MTDPNLGALLDGELSDWVDALPSYQRDHITALLASAGPIEVAEIWLGNTGPKDTAPYGGVKVVAARFYDNLLVELQKLFCGGADYEADRQNLGNAAGAGKLVIVGTISTAIAPHVGAAAAVLGPAIALTLGLLGNAGQSSICQTLKDIIDERQTHAVIDAPQNGEG